MARRPRKSAPPAPQKGDVLAQVGRWTITCKDPGYSWLIQYEDGKQRFTTVLGAHALSLAIIEAARKDPARSDEP